MRCRGLNVRRGVTRLLAGAFLMASLAALLAAAQDVVRRSAESFSVHADEFHQVPGFVAVADRRIFAVMASLNAAGYHDEAHGMQMTPLRVKVRQMVAANLQHSAEKLARWKRQYASYVQARILLPTFQDYGLRLSPDYPFQPVFPIPHKKLSRFHETLNDFWRTAKLNAVWEAVKPDYMAEVHSYQLERLQSAVDALWAYLRMSRSDTFTFVIVPNPLCQSFTAQGVHPGGYYYIVDGPRVGHDFNSHEYLHSIVEPIVRRNLPGQRRKLEEYFQASKGRTVYYGTVPNFTSECLIRALTARLALKRDNTEERRAVNNRQIDSLMNAGFLLLRPFYDLLGSFEASDLPFDRFVPQLFEKVPSYRR
jgi:hypothetical protein